MSLINKALKLEQQKRQTHSAPPPPMASQMAYRGRRSNFSTLLLGFTGMGLLLAVSITTILYFGNSFLEQRGGTFATGGDSQTGSQEHTSEANPEEATVQSKNDSEKVESIIGNLSDEQLSTVQKMLLERGGDQSPTGEIQAPPSQEPTETNPAEISAVVKIQEVVDGYSVQGIRKAGKETRVFLNGKIRRIGEVVDLELGLRLVGFNDDYLVFQTSDGSQFKKAI